MIQKSQSCDEDLRLVRQSVDRIQDDERLMRLLCEERLDATPACLLRAPDGLLVASNAERSQTVTRLEILSLELAALLPARPIEPAVKKTDWYRKIADSIKAVGQIEPIIVRPQSGRKEGYVILDGRLRREALLDMGSTRADCWVTTDTAASVNSHRHRRLTPIRELFMIRKALDRGISRRDVADALGYSPTVISRKSNLLVGVAREAQDLMIVDQMTQGVIQQLRVVRPSRQTRMVQLMVAVNDYSTAYAKCLVGATPQRLLVDSDTPKHIEGLTSATIAKLESEQEPFESDFIQAVATGQTHEVSERFREIVRVWVA